MPPSTPISSSSSNVPSTATRPSKSDYIETDTGNKVSRKCVISGSQNIILGGKTLIQPGVIIRGDLRRAGATGAAVVVSIGKYCVLGEGCILRPPAKTYKGIFSYYPMKIGDFVHIGAGSIVEAATIGSGVEIGKNCIIGSMSIIKDNAKILDNSVVGPGTVIPSLTEWGGSPALILDQLPESTPELTEAKSKSFYAKFQLE
ncbi:dynactin 5 [Microbotryum lychnidis-dioicae p1A1 Lamole]|uniref:Dynactin subunit 5 n=2 Tax=Microbotryum TaxID=34416 RepID=U5H467_USTV1|nr:dynactin 5 [Microbotryum lychnidis-dioicae p1A1 Lamole]SGY13499.1 BQ5605_C010g05877 [Microbotryum silenes-dioicae]|eukprot:KDE07652.1 dynactin 5 [Microbotryum lychnidis-dioicae p1A1 Lamole]